MKRSFIKTELNEDYSIKNYEEIDSPTKAKKKKKYKHRSTAFDDYGNESNETKGTLENKLSAVFNANETESGSQLSDDQSSRKKKKKKRKHKKDDEQNFQEDSAEIFVPKDKQMNGIIQENNVIPEFNEDIKSVNEMWPKEEILELLDRMKTAIPEKDSLKYSSRLAKLNWDSISFHRYPAAECQTMWKAIQDKIRCYRLLKEVVNDAKEWVQRPTNTLLLKGHPEKPTKPLSSFMLFYMDTKDKILKECPGLGGPDVAKRVAELWKNISAKKLEKYKNKTLKLRQEYDEKLALFYKNHPSYLQEKLLKKRKKLKSKLSEFGFEKPKSAFQLYYQSTREKYESKNADFKASELIKKCKIKWKNMPETKKVNWIEMAQKEEEHYKENLKDYELSHPGFVPPAVKTLITKNDQHVLNQISGKPKKAPCSAYALFSQIMLQSDSIKDIPTKERMTEISRRWKTLSESDKNAYTERCEQLQEKYKKEYAKYLESLTPEKRILEEEKSQPKKKKTSNDSKHLLEPKQPPLDVVKFFKLKNSNKWENTSRDIDVQAQAKWRKLSASEKNSYNEELKKLQDEYITNFGKFLKQCPTEKIPTYLDVITYFKQQQARYKKEEAFKLSEDSESDSS